MRGSETCFFFLATTTIASYAAVFSVAPSLSPHKRLWGESEGATLKTAA